MGIRRALGRQFECLWAAYAVSTFGTWIGFGALSVVAITVLDAGPAEVAALSAAGLAVGAVVAVPVGPWVEFRRKRPVMIAADLIRLCAFASLPIAYAFGVLTIGQLIAVSVVATASRIASDAASGPLVKTLVHRDDLLTANSRFESTRWSATVVGPTLGGALIGLFGPFVTICVDAMSYLLSALGVAAMGSSEPQRKRATPARLTDLADGWRIIVGQRTLRRLFANTVLVNGLIMAGEPVLAVLMLGQLSFPMWQYGLAFSLPCVGGLIGSRLAGAVVHRLGQSRALLVTGVLRACWPIGLAVVGPGLGGLAVVMVVELGLIVCCSVFNPVYVTYRQQLIETEQLSRVIAAWSISTSLCIAALTAAGGLLATITTPRTALVVAGVALLATPALLIRRSADVAVSPEARPAEASGVH
ncbi:MFS transporter [Gordonia sp. DT101]|uniref:MFS transporter n=1 Tax=Gordonia sp. DT101 TaxID=3416545 RepID=UPI003CEE7966